MNGSRRIGIGIVCAALCAGSLQAATTDNPQGAPAAGGPVIAALSKLNLTAEQKAAVAGIVKKHRDENRAAIGQVVEARKSLFAQIHAEAVDEAAIRSASRLVSQREEDLAVLRARTVAELRAVLTPGQKQILSGLRDDLMAKAESMRGRIPAAIDAWVEANGAP